MADRRIPEMVGATDQPVLLAGESASTSLSASLPTGPAREAAARGGATPEIYLNVENVTGTGAPTSYSVYVNLPPGADPADHRELLAGTLPMFGAAEASRTDASHSGSGLHYALEIGDIVRRLQAKNAWDPNDITVTFVPKHRGPERESAAAVAATNPIRVGRVSIYYG